MRKTIFLGLSAIALGTVCAPIATTSCSLMSKTEQTQPTHGEDNATTTYVTFKAKPGETGIEFVGSTYVKATVNMPFATLVTPVAKKNKYVVSAWINARTNEEMKNTDLIEKDMVLYPKFDAEVDLQACVGLAAIEYSTVTIVKHGTATPQIKYSTDGRFWTLYDWTKSEQGQLVLELKPGEVLYFKGSNPNGLSHSEYDYVSFSIGGSVSLNGNVMSLIDDGHGTEDKIPCNYCFYRLFEGCSGIVSISSNFLPAEHLKDYSYAYMFEDCQRLTDFPKTLLDDRQLYENETYQATLCYCGMFMNCKGIKRIPVGLLPATQLSTYCYYGMFQGCTGLTELDAGILPATELWKAIDSTTCLDYYGCYSSMFLGCTNITKINEKDGQKLLPATKLARCCYFGMFTGCIGLKDLSALALPATNLTFDGHRTTDAEHATAANDCYNQMFYGCTKLTNAPALPATTLSSGCYSAMFYNCGDMTVIPTVPTGNVTLASRCCEYMFYNCSKITAAPKFATSKLENSCFYDMFTNCTSLVTVATNYLPGSDVATAPYCYYGMFSGCTGLTQAPNLPSSTLSNYCYARMFSGCTSLTTAPRLAAKDPATGCYAYMFNNCNVLTGFRTGTGYAVGLTSSTTDCCKMMFCDCWALDIVRETGFMTDGNLIRIYGDTDNYAFIFQHTKNWRDSGGPVFSAGYKYSIQ